MMFGICFLATYNVSTDFFSRKIEKMELIILQRTVRT